MNSQRNNYKYTFYPSSRFGDYSEIDSTVIFYQRVNSLLDKSATLLDIGCGRGYHVEDIRIRKELRNFKNKCRTVIGIDVDKSASSNPTIDEFFLIQTNLPWPIKSQSVDVAICDFVLEHVEDPEAFFSEIYRVLKPNGYLCVRTTNLLGYVGIFARLIPEKYHKTVISKIMPSRKEIDIFPTVHRCNTIQKVKKVLQSHNFDYFVFGYEDEPGYLSLNKALYFLGYLYQKVVPNYFKNFIIAFAKKQ